MTAWELRILFSLLITVVSWLAALPRTRAKIYRILGFVNRIVHRDLKPANVLVAGGDAQPLPVVKLAVRPVIPRDKAVLDGRCVIPRGLLHLHVRF